ncbi:MAG: hypothetical protein WA188_23035 [Terriglobales bacterium]
MDTKTFIAEITKALAWPVGLITLGLIFRAHVGGLLEGMRLRRIKKGEWSADFEAGAQEVRADLPEASQTATRPAVVPGLLNEETEHLIDVAPAAAISQTWNQLEGLVAAAAMRAGIAAKLLPEVLRALVDKGAIQSSVRDSILGLRNMRNLAVHAPGERVTPRQAREFVTMAEAVMWSLEQNLRKNG